MIAQERSRPVPSTRRTWTTHAVEVDLRDALGDIDPTDGDVFVDLLLPNGRSKRVRIDPSSLVELRI